MPTPCCAAGGDARTMLHGGRRMTDAAYHVRRHGRTCGNSNIHMGQRAPCTRRGNTRGRDGWEAPLPARLTKRHTAPNPHKFPNQEFDLCCVTAVVSTTPSTEQDCALNYHAPGHVANYGGKRPRAPLVFSAHLVAPHACAAPRSKVQLSTMSSRVPDVSRAPPRNTIPHVAPNSCNNTIKPKVNACFDVGL